MRKRQPDTEAQRLVQTYADLILRLGYTYLKSTHDAEDVCQNVLIKLLQTDRAFESAEHERAWIVRATANACKDVLRDAARRWRSTPSRRRPRPRFPTAPYSKR